MNVYDNEAINEYRRSSGSSGGRRKSSRNKKKAKPIGKFEIAAFAVVVGFGIGLVVGMGIGGFTSKAGAVPVATAEQNSYAQDTSNFEAKARESLKRLESKGYDVQDLQAKYESLQHNPGDILQMAAPGTDGMIPLTVE